MEQKIKPILCLDFDGVCHDCKYGWQGATVIDGEPVAGLFEFLEEARNHFEINIYFTRSGMEGGIQAMFNWFQFYLRDYNALAGLRILDGIAISMDDLHFPPSKPSAFVTLDDRTLNFNGVWPSVEALLAFKPWHQGGEPMGVLSKEKALEIMRLADDMAYAMGNVRMTIDGSPQRVHWRNAHDGARGGLLELVQSLSR